MSGEPCVQPLVKDGKSLSGEAGFVKVVRCKKNLFLCKNRINTNITADCAVGADYFDLGVRCGKGSSDGRF